MNLMYKQVSVLKKENVALRDELSQVKMKTTYISLLKEQLTSVQELSDTISLMNNNTVVYAKYYVKWYSAISIKDYISINALSNCYKQHVFNYVIEKLDLLDHERFCHNLLNFIPYHFFEFQTNTSCNRFLCFPCFLYDLSQVADFNISIPGVVKVNIVGNELMVEIEEEAKTFKLLIGGNAKVIENGIKVDLRRLYEMDRDALPHGYACIGF